MALEVPLANLFYDQEGVLLLGEKPARCILRTAGSRGQNQKKRFKKSNSHGL